MMFYWCVGGEIARYGSFDEAIAYCNTNSGCGCIHQYGDYHIYAGTSTNSNHAYSCWVIELIPYVIILK